MIEVLPPGTEIPVATKMSILRPACYRKFADVIEEVYARFERGTGAPKRDIASPVEMEAFLADTFRAPLGEADGLERDTDLFAFGVDSLQATRVRNALQKGLELGGATLGQNIVYDHPSIARLAEHLLAVRSGTAGGGGDVHAAMLAMVDKWAAQVDAAAPDAEGVPEKHVVVLTGATGSLGAHILDQLLRRPEVAEVVCLARARSHADATARVEASLAQRRRSVPARWRALAADVNRPDLGLTTAEYEALRASATAVIHNAWPVNFVLSLASFDEHVGGAVHLLNLARRSRAAFFFSSSVGTRQGRPEYVPETFPDDPATAAGMGYAQSKWVEKILERAGGAGVLRIGQLVGDTEHGVWNETEAWPLMFRTARVLGALPLLEETPAWLPVDTAARAVADLVIAHAPGGVYHVVNPRAAEWRTVVDGLAAGGLEFDRVPATEWLDKLAASYPDPETNPSYKLLSFWEGRLGARPHIEFSVERTAQLSPAIAGCEAVSAGLAARWVAAWRASGFL
jgi:thioester reductase-like protein